MEMEQLRLEQIAIWIADYSWRLNLPLPIALAVKLKFLQARIIAY